MPKIYGKVNVLNGLDVITGSLTIEANSDLTIKTAPGKSGGIKDQVYGDIIPTGSFTGSYDGLKPIGLLNYGINSVVDPPLRPGGSQNQLIGYGRWSGNPRDYGLRLPSPVAGLSLKVQNGSNLEVRIFPSHSLGQIGQQPEGAEYKMMPGPYMAIFNCISTGSSGEGVWTVQHNVGTFRTLTNTFSISHTSGSATVAAVPLEAPANSTNEFDNVAAGVYGFININGQGVASKGFIYPSSSLSSNGIPRLDTSLSYPDPSLTSLPKNPDDYMQVFGDNGTGAIEYITGVRLDSNITSSDYYPNATSNIANSAFGGVCLFGWYNFLQNSQQVATGAGYPYLPFFRDVGMDILAASFGDENYDDVRGIRRVLPQENPPSYDPQNPGIGQLYTEYFSPELNGRSGGFRSNPMPVGALINFTSDYILDPSGNNAQPLRYHAPGNAWNLVIPPHYETKTYKFRLTTEVYRAN